MIVYNAAVRLFNFACVLGCVYVFVVDGSGVALVASIVGLRIVFLSRMA